MPGDLAAVKASGCEVLGLRYRTDAATGTRFDTLRRELGDRFLAVEFEGKGHSVLTAHRREFGVDEVLAFLDRTLLPTVVRDAAGARRRAGARHSRPGCRPASPRASRASPTGSCFSSSAGLTDSGRKRIEGITRDETGLTPEIVRLTPTRQDMTAESTA